MLPTSRHIYVRSSFWVDPMPPWHGVACPGLADECVKVFIEDSKSINIHFQAHIHSQGEEHNSSYKVGYEL